MIISSVSPSLKYSCVGSLLRFANGSTTSRTLALSAAGFDGRPHHVQIAHRLPFGLDRGDEAVAAPMQRLDEPRVVGIVAERRAQPFDRGVQAVLEVDERSRRPQALAQLFARHDFARPLEHHHENFKRLILKPDADSPFRSSRARTSTSKVPNRLTFDERRSSGQHRKGEVYQPARAFAPFHQNVNVA